ncbi:unnamed protein product [Mytilus coruscus]|uniref:MAM domain-containing protein n=1 Tax=Mytilus coruscus TaxID=42192 RepID=A0A6J8DRL2_MYTCO|nr:unnamed protein product [Mytilus coruscus]
MVVLLDRFCHSTNCKLTVLFRIDYKTFRLSDKPAKSITCKPTSTISINHVYVEDGNCNSSTCVLEDNDHALVYSNCNGSTSCLLDFNLTSPCLYGKRHFDYSYVCKAPESYTCNFELDFCNWLPGNGGTLYWTRTTADNPLVDQTRGSGYYIVVYNNANNGKGQAELSSGSIVSNRTNCLSFWYNMRSEIDANGSKLILYLSNKDDDNRIQLKEYNKSTDEKWIRGTVNLPGIGSYKIVFVGVVYEKWSDYVGLDDVDIFHGNCSENDKVVYTFEKEEGWVNLDGQTVDWVRRNGENKTDNLLPYKDHTISSGDGYYFFISSKKHPNETVGRLKSYLPMTGRVCVSFWYYMNGSSSSILRLYKNSESPEFRIHNIEGTTSDDWKKATVNILANISEIYYLILEGFFTNTVESIIAVDDISVLNGSCQGQSISENRFFQDHCFNIDDNFSIDECLSSYRDTSELNLFFEPALETSNMECKGIENKIKENVSSLCKENIFSKCDVNLHAIFGEQEQECMIYNKDIVLEYSCTELSSINEYSTVPYHKEELFNMTSVAVAIAACVGLVACLIIAGLCVFKRQTEKQRTLNNDNTSRKPDSMNIGKTNKVRSTTKRDASLAVHEYIDIDLRKGTSVSDQSKNKENVFAYELAKPLTSDTGCAFPYDIAKPLSTVDKDGRSYDISVSNTPKECSAYDTTKMNDSTKYNGYNETDNIVIYSRTFDGVYDVANCGKRTVRNDNTYEHCATPDKQ